MTAREAMLQFFSRAADPCSGGRQMPGHWSYPRLKVVTGSSPVATQILHATGIALASKLKREPHVTAVYFGEGCTAGGDHAEGQERDEQSGPDGQTGSRQIGCRGQFRRSPSGRGRAALSCFVLRRCPTPLLPRAGKVTRPALGERAARRCRWVAAD